MGRIMNNISLWVMGRNARRIMDNICLWISGRNGRVILAPWPPVLTKPLAPYIRDGIHFNNQLVTYNYNVIYIYKLVIYIYKANSESINHMQFQLSTCKPLLKCYTLSMSKV